MTEAVLNHVSNFQHHQFQFHLQEDLDEDEEELPERPLLSTRKVEKYDLHKNLKNNKELEEILNKYIYELLSFYKDNDDTNISRA